MGTPVDEKSVQAAVEEAYKCMLEMVMEDEEDLGEELTVVELVEAFVEGIQDMVSEHEFQQMVDHQCGEGATEYIIQAVQMFRNKKSNDSML